MDDRIRNRHLRKGIFERANGDTIVSLDHHVCNLNSVDIPCAVVCKIQVDTEVTTNQCSGLVDIEVVRNCGVSHDDAKNLYVVDGGCNNSIARRVDLNTISTSRVARQLDENIVNVTVDLRGGDSIIGSHSTQRDRCSANDSIVNNLQWLSRVGAEDIRVDHTATIGRKHDSFIVIVIDRNSINDVDIHHRVLAVGVRYDTSTAIIDGQTSYQDVLSQTITIKFEFEVRSNSVS